MSSKSSSGVSGAAAFLEKLYGILDDVQHSEYIAWQPSGDAFLIKKVDGLQEHVLPRFFKHSNLQSFVRQLNMYGFSKTSHDPSHREFRHPNFLKGRRDLLGQIKRKAQNQSSHAGGEESAISPSLSCLSAASAVRPRAQSASFSSSFTAAAAAATASAGRQRQSSSGASSSEDAGAESEDLRWRIARLETKTWILSERYQELNARHDSLCKLLGSALSNSGAWAGDGAGAESKSVLTSVIRAWAGVEDSDQVSKTSLSAGDCSSSSSNSGTYLDFNLHALSPPGPGSELVRMISIEQVVGAQGVTAGTAAESGSGVGGVSGVGGRDRGLLDLIDAATLDLIDTATFSVLGGHGGHGKRVGGEASATDEESIEDAEASAGRKRGGGNKFAVDRLEGEKLSRTRTV